MDISVSVMALKAENITPVNKRTGREYQPEPGGGQAAMCYGRLWIMPPRRAVMADGAGS